METSLERGITLRQLRIFISVIEHRSFTRAAEVLSLTQPAVTHQMQALARAVGQPCSTPGAHPRAHRGGQALQSAPAGSWRWSAMRRRRSRTSPGCARPGRVAGDTTVGIYVLPDAVAAFHRDHPGVALSLDVVNRAQGTRTAPRGHRRHRSRRHALGGRWLAAEPFLENSLMCFCAPGHPLAEREALQPGDLLDGPLLLRERGSGTRDSAERILRDAVLNRSPPWRWPATVR